MHLILLGSGVLIGIIQELGLPLWPTEDKIWVSEGFVVILK